MFAALARNALSISRPLLALQLQPAAHDTIKRCCGRHCPLRRCAGARCNRVRSAPTPKRTRLERNEIYTVPRHSLDNCSSSGLSLFFLRTLRAACQRRVQPPIPSISSPPHAARCRCVAPCARGCTPRRAPRVRECPCVPCNLVALSPPCAGSRARPHARCRPHHTVRKRIQSTKNIQKITASMKMVSAAKMRGDQRRLDAGRNFGVRVWPHKGAAWRRSHGPHLRTAFHVIRAERAAPG